MSFCIKMQAAALRGLMRTLHFFAYFCNYTKLNKNMENIGFCIKMEATALCGLTRPYAFTTGWVFVWKWKPRLSFCIKMEAAALRGLRPFYGICTFFGFWIKIYFFHCEGGSDSRMAHSISSYFSVRKKKQDNLLILTLSDTGVLSLILWRSFLKLQLTSYIPNAPNLPHYQTFQHFLLFPIILFIS